MDMTTQELLDRFEDAVSSYARSGSYPTYQHKERLRICMQERIKELEDKAARLEGLEK